MFNLVVNEIRVRTIGMRLLLFILSGRRGKIFHSHDFINFKVYYLPLNFEMYFAVLNLKKLGFASEKIF